ncbi:MAG: hypothetical protein WCJ58_05245 [bacterium]
MKIWLNSLIDKLPGVTKKEQVVEWKLVLLISFALFIVGLILFTVFDFVPKEVEHASTCSLTCPDNYLDPVTCSCVNFMPTDMGGGQPEESCSCSNGNLLSSSCLDTNVAVCAGNSCSCLFPTVTPTIGVELHPSPTPTVIPVATNTVIATQSVANTNTPVPTNITSQVTLEATITPNTQTAASVSCLVDPGQSKCQIAIAISNIVTTPEKTLATAKICWDTNVATKGYVSFGTIVANKGTFSQSTVIENQYNGSHCAQLTGLDITANYVFKIIASSEVGNAANYQGTFAFEPGLVLALPETGECIEINKDQMEINPAQVIINYQATGKNSCQLQYDFENVTQDQKYTAVTTLENGIFFSQMDLNIIPYANDLYYSIACTNLTPSTTPIVTTPVVTANNVCNANGIINFDLFKTFHPAYVAPETTKATTTDQYQNNQIVGMIRSVVKLYQSIPVILQLALCATPSLLGIGMTIISYKRSKQTKMTEEGSSKY